MASPGALRTLVKLIVEGTGDTRVPTAVAPRAGAIPANAAEVLNNGKRVFKLPDGTVFSVNKERTDQQIVDMLVKAGYSANTDTLAGLRAVELSTDGGELIWQGVGHKSPHDFPADPGFDMAKLRTGQGAHMSGPGIYNYEAPEVGRHYDREFGVPPRIVPKFDDAKIAMTSDDINAGVPMTSKFVEKLFGTGPLYPDSPPEHFVLRDFGNELGQRLQALYLYNRSSHAVSPSFLIEKKIIPSLEQKYEIELKAINNKIQDTQWMIDEYLNNAKMVDSDGKPIAREDYVLPPHMKQMQDDIEMYKRSLEKKQLQANALKTLEQDLKTVSSHISYDLVDGKPAHTYESLLKVKAEEIFDYDSVLNPNEIQKIRDAAMAVHPLQGGDRVNAVGTKNFIASLDRRTENSIEGMLDAGDVIKALQDSYHNDGAVMDILKHMGWKVIKFLDAGSRYTGPTDAGRTWNTIVMDLSVLKIMRKYGVAGAVGLASTMASMQSGDVSAATPEEERAASVAMGDVEFENSVAAGGGPTIAPFVDAGVVNVEQFITHPDGDAALGVYKYKDDAIILASHLYKEMWQYDTPIQGTVKGTNITGITDETAAHEFGHRAHINESYAELMGWYRFPPNTQKAFNNAYLFTGEWDAAKMRDVLEYAAPNLAKMEAAAYKAAHPGAKGPETMPAFWMKQFKQRMAAWPESIQHPDGHKPMSADDKAYIDKTIEAQSDVVVRAIKRRAEESEAGTPTEVASDQQSSKKGDKRVKVTVEEMRPVIGPIAQKNGIPPEVLIAKAMTESSLWHGQTSRAGAKGLFQMLPATGKAYGDTSGGKDWKKQAAAAAKMLMDMKKKFGTWPRAWAAYNWGETNLRAHLRKGGKLSDKSVPEETRKHVAKMILNTRKLGFDPILEKPIIKKGAAGGRATEQFPD